MFIETKPATTVLVNVVLEDAIPREPTIVKVVIEDSVPSPHTVPKTSTPGTI